MIGEKATEAAGNDPLERLSDLLAPEMAAVDRILHDRMRGSHAPRIADVTAHLVDAGGKRLRPMLVLAAAALCGRSRDKDARKLAATVEFIHTATLLHDDVVDESRKRRGRPTANLLWDNKSSVLVGDYLFARSFQLMVEPGNLRVLDILANASAVIAEGEVLQLTAAQDLATGEDTYLRIIRGKTAALFSAATESGAVIAGAAAPWVNALRDYGDALGIAFQIADDTLDYASTATQLGKNPGDDFRERKLTLPLIKAVAKADEAERAFWERVIARGQQQEGDLERAEAIMARHGTVAAAQAEAGRWAARARAALAPLPANPMRDLLGELAGFVVTRRA